MSEYYDAIVPIRWSDMDVFQHVNHARMLTILEEARIPWLFYDDKPTKNLRDGCVVVDLSIKYIQQVKHIEGPLTVTMHLSKLRNFDFTIKYEVRKVGEDKNNSPSIIAETHLASFDIETQKLRRLTVEEKSYLSKFYFNVN